MPPGARPGLFSCVPLRPGDDRDVFGAVRRGPPDHARRCDPDMWPGMIALLRLLQAGPRGCAPTVEELPANSVVGCLLFVAQFLSLCNGRRTTDHGPQTIPA